MTDELSGVADIATGAVIASAVEPNAAEVTAGTMSGRLNGNCLNCGTSLAGTHCYNCGQKGNVHRTLHAFGHDFLHSVLHLDGKIWRTLPMLFWRPGDLTRRYIHGERAKFVSPLALFLFSVFLTFAAFNWLAPTNINVNPELSTENAATELAANRKEIVDEITKLETEKQLFVASGAGDDAWMDDAITRYRSELKKIDTPLGDETRFSDMAAQKLRIEKSKAQTEIARLKAKIASAQKAGAPTDAIAAKLEEAQMGEEILGNVSGGLEGKRAMLEMDISERNIPGAEKLNEAVKQANANPQLLIYKIQSNAYKFSWALIPLSVPFVWLLFFWRRRFKMFDHAVFVTYSLSFMMLIGTLCAILIQFPSTEVAGGLALTFVPPIHMYRQLHDAYGTSRFGAFWRMCALTMFAVAALILFVALIVTLGVTG